MPEGPECAAYADKINKLGMYHTNLLSIEVVSGRYSKKLPEGFASFSLPKLFGSVGVKGKFLYFEFLKQTKEEYLCPDVYVWNTLGLTGGWYDAPHKHARLKFEFDKQILWYCDQTNFGTFHFGKSLKETSDKLDTLGVDLLNDEVNVKATHTIFSLKKNQDKTTAEILMNQENYAGIGNYIKAEVLYICKISPWRLGKDVTLAEQAVLHQAIDNIINSAYTDKEFTKFIYKRSIAPCGASIISETTKDKRTTWWAPSVQK